MTRYLPTEAQEWRTIEVVGVPMKACRLWEGDHNVKSGLFHMPQGMTVPTHHHPYWCQIYVVKGEMEVQLEGEAPHTIASGGYYFVEPGDTHRETALTDTLLLTICEEDRPEFRREPAR